MLPGFATYEVCERDDPEQNHDLAKEGLGDLDRVGQNVCARRGAVDRPGVRTLGIGISSDLAHQGMVDPTGYTVKLPFTLPRMWPPSHRRGAPRSVAESAPVGCAWHKPSAAAFPRPVVLC